VHVVWDVERGRSAEEERHASFAASARTRARSSQRMALMIKV